MIETALIAAIAAIAKAWRENGGSFAGDGPEQFGKFLRDELSPFAPSLFQEQAGAPPELPKLWRDPLTNEPLPNPWLTNDNKAKAFLGGTIGKPGRDPALAKHFQKMAKDPYGTVAEIQDAQARAAQRKQIKYDETTHAENPYLTDNLTAKGRLEKTDPERAEVYRAEAKPVELPWELGKKHQTGLGKIARHNPELRNLVERASAHTQTWAKAELQRTQAELAQRSTEAARLEKALNGGGTRAHARR